MNDIEENMDNNSYNDTKNRKNPAGIIMIAAAVVIFLVAVGGIIPFIMAKNLVGDAIRKDTTQYNVPITAVITENRVRESDGGPGNSIADTITCKVYTPVYEYEYRGKTYSVAGSVASSEKKYEVGDKVNVLISDANPGKMYDPEYNPTKVIDDFGHKISGTFILILVVPIIMLAVLTAFVIIIILRASKKNKANNDEENDHDPNDDYRG